VRGGVKVLYPVVTSVCITFFICESILQFQSRHNSHTGHCYVISFGAGKRLDVIGLITIMKHMQCSVSCFPGKQKVGVKNFFSHPHLQNRGAALDGRRIGNRTQAFEWYQFEWASVTFQGHDYSTPNIQLYLQWLTNTEDSYYDLSNSAIFNNLERPLSQVSRSRHSLTLNTS